MATVAYNINPMYAGLIIGKGGEGIRSLERMQGVQNILFDTTEKEEQWGKVYKLHVTAANRAACDAVNNVVQTKIKLIQTKIKVKSPVRPIHGHSRTFIDVNDKSLDIITLRPYADKDTEEVIVNDRTTRIRNFVISAFSSGSLEDMLAIDLGKSYPVKTGFFELTNDNVTQSLREALKNYEHKSGQILDFHVSPGKMIFTGQDGPSLSRAKLTGTNGANYMREKGLRKFFTPNLHPKYIGMLNNKLAELEFDNLNEGCPQTYTHVHLDITSSSENSNCSVVMTQDKDSKTSMVDPRLSEEKKKMIKKIMLAKTVGEVLGLTSASVSYIPLSYFKVLRNVDPKNNLHPGAANAYKKLLDAYDKVNAGLPTATNALTLPYESDSEDLVPMSKPEPKIVKVKTKRTSMFAFTIVSNKDLDVRATMKSYKEDCNNLTDGVRETLHLCWDQRDSAGILSSLSTRSEIVVLCVKQVLELYTWMKQVTFQSYCGEKAAFVEVKVKKLREKSGLDTEWIDTVEVDLKLKPLEDDEITGERLSFEMMEMKRWIEKIFL